MSHIIEHDDGATGAGRATAADEPSVSLKLYQDIYHRITGKTEEIRKRYSDSFQIDFDDIGQLDIKINQVLDVHNVIASNSSYTIYYESDRKDVFTSFHKLQAFNASSPSPVGSVVLQYNFSIIPAKLSRPQEYSITIRLASRVAQLKGLKESAPSFMHPVLITMAASETAEVRVEYADYVIARGFIEAFDEWMKGTSKTKENKILRWVQRHSHYIPPLGKLIIAFLYGAFLFEATTIVFGGGGTFESLARYFISSFVIFFIAISISDIILRATERSIDSFILLSWIKLTKGDEALVENAQSNSKSNVLKLILSTVSALALGVASSQLSGWLDGLAKV